jgi:UDP-N-acetylglucosamine 2-epimerase
MIIPNNLDLVIIAGDRPEVIKLPDLVKSSFEGYKHAFLYTGQIYSKNMKDIFFDKLEMQPTYR